MNNFAVRVVSAVAMMIVGFSALVLDLRSRWALVALVLCLGAWEFSRMVGAKLGGPRLGWLAALATLAFLIPDFPGLASLDREEWLAGTAVTAVLLFTLAGFRWLDIAAMAPWIYLNVFACAYFGVYASAIFGLLRPVAGWQGIFPLLMLQILIATADTGAYLSGKALGKRKLCPSISSGKTIEGAVGGSLLTVAMALLLGPKLLETGALANLGLGLLMAVTAIMGDLFISILKRYAGVKDSSHLIPGHGGILDRFDSLLFSAPAAVFYLRLVHG